MAASCPLGAGFRERLLLTRGQAGAKRPLQEKKRNKRGGQTCADVDQDIRQHPHPPRAGAHRGLTRTPPATGGADPRLLVGSRSDHLDLRCRLEHDDRLWILRVIAVLAIQPDILSVILFQIHVVAPHVCNDLSSLTSLCVPGAPPMTLPHSYNQPVKRNGPSWGVLQQLLDRASYSALIRAISTARAPAPTARSCGWHRLMPHLFQTARPAPSRGVLGLLHEELGPAQDPAEITL